MREEQIVRLIDKWTRRFARTIPNGDEDKSDMVAKFRECMFLGKGFLEKDSVVRASRFLMTWGINKRAKHFINLPLITKKRMFAKDPNMDKVYDMSGRYFNLAKETLLKGDRLTEKIDFDEFDEEAIVSEMAALRDGVRDLNKPVADELIVEIRYDLNLIRNPWADEVSNRMLQFMDTLLSTERKEINERCLASQSKYDS